MWNDRDRPLSHGISANISILDCAKNNNTWSQRDYLHNLLKKSEKDETTEISKRSQWDSGRSLSFLISVYRQNPVRSQMRLWPGKISTAAKTVWLFLIVCLAE